MPRVPATAKVRLVQGSHIVVPQLFDHGRSYVFQNPDGRIVFAIPYEGAYTMIGTTEVDYAGDPGQAVAGAEEIAYLCKRRRVLRDPNFAPRRSVELFRRASAS
jgi:glycerol-3-phosphate dehydrogenase